MEINFLKIHPNITVAQDLGESPDARFGSLKQIQFLPRDPQPYFQITDGSLPLSFSEEDYKVYLVRCTDKVKFEITPNVLLKSIVVNGIAQIKIRLAYLPNDYGSDLMYLEIDRYGSGLKKYYSNKFLVTSNNNWLTSRLDYVNPKHPTDENGNPFFQSVRLRFFFNNFVDSTEISTYFQITTNQNVNPRIMPKEYAEWKTQIFNAWTYKRLSRSFYGGRCYINQVRNYPIEGLKYEARQGQTNISEMQFITDPDELDTITIIPVIIDPGYQTIPFLSSSSQKSSNSFLSSQSTITIPIP